MPGIFMLIVNMLQCFYRGIIITETYTCLGFLVRGTGRSQLFNSLSASLLLNIFLSFEVGIAHAIANFKWKENTSSLKN